MRLGALGTAGAVTAALAAGWTGTTLLIVAILVPTAAICWVLADNQRPQRLALLLAAWRHGNITPTRRTAGQRPRRAVNPPASKADKQQ